MTFKGDGQGDWVWSANAGSSLEESDIPSTTVNGSFKRIRNTNARLAVQRNILSSVGPVRPANPHARRHEAFNR